MNEDELNSVDDLAETIQGAIELTLDEEGVPYNGIYIWKMAKKIADDLINGDGANPYYE